MTRHCAWHVSMPHACSEVWSEWSSLKGTIQHLNMAILITCCSDWTSQLPLREFDLVVANPPYIASAARDTLSDTVKHYEPELALFGGVTGLEGKVL